MHPSWAVVALLALCAILVVGWWRAATRAKRATRARQRRARRGEDEAERLLARHGYTVVGRQVNARWRLVVDGVAVEVGCRADLVVEGRDGRFVAEVKTGDLAPDPTWPATRRQLLEYLVAFDGEVDGVLLVDMERGEVMRIERYALPE